MPRLFTGLEIPPKVALDLQIMQGGIPGARWMEPSNYHLTIRFIGDIEQGLAREIAQGLDGVASNRFACGSKVWDLSVATNPIHSMLAWKKMPNCDACMKS